MGGICICDKIVYSITEKEKKSVFILPNDDENNQYLKKSNRVSLEQNFVLDNSLNL